MERMATSVAFRYVALLLSSILATNGCAYGTLIRGTKQDLLFNSSPVGATVKVNGQEIGKTPLTWKMPRKNGALIEFRKDKCADKQVMVDSSLSPIVFANLLPFLLWGLIIGGIIDTMSGGAYKLEPDPVYVSLDCPDEKDATKEKTAP